MLLDTGAVVVNRRQRQETEKLRQDDRIKIYLLGFLAVRGSVSAEHVFQRGGSERVIV